MTTLEKIKNLNDNDVLSLYNGFYTFLINELNIDGLEVLQNPPESLKEIEVINSLKDVEQDNLAFAVKPSEVSNATRQLLEQFASNSEISPILDKFIDSNKIHPMAAGTIIAVGSLLLMTLVSTSLKIEYKDGKFSLSYGTKNISNNAVEMVKAVLTSLPESIKDMFKKKN